MLETRKFSVKHLKKGGLAILALFILINGALALWYRHKTYPNTVVSNRAIGVISLAALPEQANKLAILPDKIKLVYKDQNTSVTPADLGITVDGKALQKAAGSRRSWLPLVNIFSAHRLEARFLMDPKKFNVELAKLETIFKKDAVDAKINIDDGRFSIIPPASGYLLQTSKTQETIINALEAGERQITLPVKETKPNITALDLNGPLETVKKQFSTEVAYLYEGQRKIPSPHDRTAWYVPENSTYVLSAAAVKKYIQAVGQGFGITVGNIDAATKATVMALESGKWQDITLTKYDPVKTFTYCVAERGVSDDLQILKAKLAQTYSDPRGWSLGGKTRFVENTAGCDFTVWLAAAAQMPSFGGVCDSLWSCRIANNVVINADRWNGASDAWNAAGLSLDDYRSMVINHETGHWFGFNHSDCPGAGQLAPVMQQQSISLQGCTFNPWPLPGELANLQRNLGL